MDAIISVGYRVNSKQGTQFRIWASNRLKEYLIQGYSTNQKRLNELNQLIQIIANTEDNANEISEAKGLLNVLSKYTKSFILLNQFDSDTIELNNLDDNITFEIDYHDAYNAIVELKNQLIQQKEATALFGNQKDQSFQGILKSVTQTFDGIYLYPN